MLTDAHIIFIAYVFRILYYSPCHLGNCSVNKSKGQGIPPFRSLSHTMTCGQNPFNLVTIATFGYAAGTTFSLYVRQSLGLTLGTYTEIDNVTPQNRGA